MMRFAAVLTLAMVPVAAWAGCEEDIRGFYEDGGLFDPAELTPQEHAVTWVEADGSETKGNISRWENASRSISDNNGSFLMSYDGKFYQGPGWDGPWEDMGYPAQGDAVEMGRAMNAVVAAHLAETDCAGKVKVNGTKALKYTYHYRVETSGGASWWESDYTLYVNAKTGERLRTEERNLKESWAPDVVKHLRVTDVTPMPGYTIPNAPDG